MHTDRLHTNFLHKSLLADIIFSLHVHICTRIKMILHVWGYQYRMDAVCSIIQKSECSPSSKSCLRKKNNFGYLLTRSN